MSNFHDGMIVDPHSDMYSAMHWETKEVYETDDDIEALHMIETRDWVILNGAIQGDKVMWCLGRIRGEKTKTDHPHLSSVQGTLAPH